MNLTATDRSALIRLASSLPKGSEERKTILAGLQKVALKKGQKVSVPGVTAFAVPREQVEALRTAGQKFAGTALQWKMVGRHSNERYEAHPFTNVDAEISRKGNGWEWWIEVNGRPTVTEKADSPEEAMAEAYEYYMTYVYPSL